jgi:hypothetical protein
MHCIAMHRLHFRFLSHRVPFPPDLLADQLPGSRKHRRAVSSSLLSIDNLAFHSSVRTVGMMRSTNASGRSRGWRKIFLKQE